MFSPDGQWVAYHSNESGRNEVYVRPFPGPGGKWQVSIGGGSYPTWSRTNRELFYSLDGQIMVASFGADSDTFRGEKAAALDGGALPGARRQPRLDLHPDGKRLAVALPVQTPSDTKQDKVVFIFNFSTSCAESRRRQEDRHAVTASARQAAII
jgi:hypothetical protein